MRVSRPTKALARFSVITVLAVSLPMAATADGITEEEFRKILAEDEAWIGNWWNARGSGAGEFELLLVENVTMGVTWWDGYVKSALNIRIGAGTLVFDIEGQNRTYKLRYVKDGESYKLSGTLTGDYRDGSGTFVYDILVRPKK